MAELTVTSRISLQPFCATGSHRYSLGTPYIREGVEYATDGKILVWRPTAEPDTGPRLAPAAQVIVADMKLATLTGWKPLAIETLRLVDRVERCEHCKGTGKMRCSKCYGSGKCGGCGAVCQTCKGDTEARFDHPECKGTGEVVRRSDIDSNGNRKPLQDATLDGYSFDYRMLALLTLLPDAEYVIRDQSADGMRCGMLIVRWREGGAALCGIDVEVRP